jgi:hypothetical protein
MRGGARGVKSEMPPGRRRANRLFVVVAVGASAPNKRAGVVRPH